MRILQWPLAVPSRLQPPRPQLQPRQEPFCLKQVHPERKLVVSEYVGSLFFDPVVWALHTLARPNMSSLMLADGIAGRPLFSQLTVFDSGTSRTFRLATPCIQSAARVGVCGLAYTYRQLVRCVLSCFRSSSVPSVRRFAAAREAA